MNKLASFVLTCTVLLPALSACNKVSDDPTPTPTSPDYLTSHSWKLVSVIGTFDVKPPITKDTFSDLKPCQKDNFLKFSPDHTVVYDNGPTKCNPAEPQQESGTWAFSNGGQQLAMTLGGQNAFPAPVYIKELSATTLRLSYTTVLGNIGSQDPTLYSATVEQTYMAQ